MGIMNSIVLTHIHHVQNLTRMANDVNAWDLYGNTIKLTCEDNLTHNTHRTFRAWLFTF